MSTKTKAGFNANAKEKDTHVAQITDKTIATIKITLLFKVIENRKYYS
jgi:hypothetical protein